MTSTSPDSAPGHRSWRRIAPWLTPALVVVEIVLVGSGLLTLADALLLIVALEVLLVLTALTRTAVALRHYRIQRATGSDRWDAALDGMAQLLPRPLARLLLIEARIWVCLVQAIPRRHAHAPAHAPARDFGYDTSLRPLLLGVLALLVFEGALVDGILAVLLGPGSVWVWIALGLHLYALVWIGGFLASLRVLPHHLGPDALILRDSVFTTLTIPYPAIARAHARRATNFGRSGLKLDPTTGEALLAYGDATVEVYLHPDPAILINGTPDGNVPRVLRITADDPNGLVHALTQAITATE